MVLRSRNRSDNTVGQSKAAALGFPIPVYFTFGHVAGKGPDKMIPGGHLLITRQLLEGLPAGNPNVMNFVD